MSIRIEIRKIMKMLSKKFGGSDGFFLIERSVEFLAKSIDGKIKYKRFYSLLREYSEAHASHIDGKVLGTYLSKEAEKKEITYKELCSVKDYLTLIILRETVEDSKNITERQFEDCVTAIRKIREIDTEELINKVSLCEKYLLNNDEIYANNDDKTKNNCRRLISQAARKKKISELEAAKELMGLGLYKQERPFAGKLYFPTVYIFPAVICFICLCGGMPLLPVLLFYIPLTELTKQLCDVILSRIIKAVSVPRLKFTDVPESSQTIVTITALLTEDNLDELFNKLEKYSLCNKYSNVSYALLADFEDSAKAYENKNSEISEKAIEKLDELNKRYENKFCLFIRPQTYCDSEGKYMGWERKRGAIIELVGYLKNISANGGAGFETVVCGDNIKNAKYIITLDSDTRLYPGAVLDMVGAMSHPANTPKTEGGIVTSGYGVMQPRTETSLESAGKTPFSLIQSEGGSDIYSFAFYETYMALYGEGIFCGKGIFDVDVFAETVFDAFPKNMILSHDMIEGAYLRTAALTDVPLTDGSPKNPLSHYKRLHRWIRGDVQTAAYVFGSRSRENAGKKPKISRLSKYKIIDNLRRAAVPIFVVLCFISTLFFGGKHAEITALLPLLYILYRPVYSIVSMPWALFRRFFGFTLTPVERSVLSSTLDLYSLGYTAQVTVDAVARALLRLFVTRKKLLEWTTADSADKKKATRNKYLSKIWPSAVLGIILCVFSHSAIACTIGFLWAAFPIVAFMTGKEPSKNKKQDCRLNRQVINKYVYDTWKFFDTTVGKKDNFLPPDNRQLSPVEAVAHRTSPTNIGLYLLSCLAVRDFGFIDSEELFLRLSKTISTIENLPKFCGHLYNWYDTETLDVIGHAYVSTVDSGNFVTSLNALENGLTEYLSEEQRFAELIPRIKAIRQNCDLRMLYNEKKKLFAIGYDTVLGKLSENCYDLFMSEARTTSYYAIANGIVPREHWSMLGRPFITDMGYVGTASWTGTMFEYFMPSLLLPTPCGSLSYESLNFALSQQMRDLSHGLWGRSESGYYAFDPAMNYLYRAFGVQKLGIKRGLDRDRVISPYSSFLAMSASPRQASKNLEKMKNIGLYGECGFYEAIDFTKRRVKNRTGESAVVRSYMAHHTGMSIVAAANACFDNVFVNRFFASPEIAAARELLEEKVTVHAKCRLKNIGENAKKQDIRTSSLPKSLDKSVKSSDSSYGVITNGAIKITASSEGFIHLESGDDALTVDSFEDGRLNGLRFFIENNGNVVDLTENAQMIFSRSEIIYRKKVDKALFRLRLAVHPNYKCFLLNLTAENVYGSICPMVTFEPLMCRYKSYRAHRSFTALSVESEYDKNDGTLIFRRLPRLADEEEKNLCISFEASGQGVDFITRKDPSLPLLYDEEDLKKLLSANFEGFTGACITPFCGMKKRSENVSGRYFCDFLISYGKSKNEATSVIRSVRNEVSANKKRKRKGYSSYPASFKLPTSLPSLRDLEAKWLITLLMNAITNRKYVTESYGGDFCGPENLWSLGISGDLPIICLEIKKELSFDDSVYRIIKAFLVAHRHFMLSGTRFDIAVLYKGTGEYFDKTRALLVEMTDRIGSPFLSSRNGGIFFVDSKNFRDSEVLRTWSSYYASLNKDTVVEKLILSQKKSSTFCVLKDQNDSVCEKEPAIQKHNVSSSTLTKTNVGETIEIPGGAFTQDGFEIRKKEVTLPWSYVYANPIFGTLLTQNSLGYTWKGNCHSKRITPWNCDGYSEASGEKMILTVGEERYDMCACADSVTYGCGFAEYVGVCGGIKFSICVGIDARLPVKMMIVRTNGGKVSYELEPLMGTDFGCVHSLQTRLENGILYFRNVKSQDFKENGFIYRIENESAIKNNGDNNENGSEICFLLGAFPDGGEAVVLRAIEKFPNSAAIRLGFAEYTKRIFSKETEFILKSDFPSFDLFVNRYLPYQTKTIRMTARGGFYQSGGAYGFRDQLQDSLAPLYFEPSLTRRQIIRCACHQYSEGDVMHWWHQKRTGPVGVRTRCSDDYLWLPYVTALYVEHTGDESVLSLSLPYVESDKLKDWELERCETPSFTKRKESLYLHCVRAIELALSRIGDRGLPLIGTGDWNDGMNMIGVEGKGESVWLGFFLCTVLHKFSGICKMMNESETAKIFEKERSLLLKSLEKNWTGDRYIRAYFDDGAPIGTDDCRCCKIDLLPQAFSALTDGVDEDKMRAALSSAKQHLYDSDVGIMKLFSPPFSRKSDEKNNPGYIQSYVPGIRENGGQYTHAAVWGAWAYFAGGYYDFATELLLKLNPAQKYLDGLDEIYRGEPYFMAGDVYSNQDYNGRAGWTLYTGAAAWYYRIILSELLGYNCFGEYFSITPKLTEKFNSFELTIRKDNTEYVIKAALGDKNEYFLDGKTTKNFFSFDKRRHILKITVEKNK